MVNSRPDLVPELLTGGVPAGSGFVGRIPVRNLWLLMLYASELFRVRAPGLADIEDNPDDLPNLIAEMLLHAVERRRRRQLSVGYTPREAVLGRVRGRVDVLETERRHLLQRGLVACRFEELNVDTPRNRFVRFALERVSRVVSRKDLAGRCRALAVWFAAAGVSAVADARGDRTNDRFGRRDPDDALMLQMARLAIDLALPAEAVGTRPLFMPDREDQWARKLFEHAIGGFYETCLPADKWRVRRGLGLDWQIERTTSGLQAIMPAMRTDVVVDRSDMGRRLVIDTKFTSIVTAGWHRETTLRSGYIYQIYAYLRSQVGKGELAADGAAGLLMHPAINEAVDESVRIQGHDIRFATVGLAASPKVIRARLLELVDQPG